ncbi:hypothetical protein [Cupriavidus basilensis]|uniref:hypothetical protein n=1 Tax=Cupriavidus basilensis TaxID=68895 RepID=UPI000AC9993E|nr:hypothetical protein [Cupriavidus basilensis]
MNSARNTTPATRIAASLAISMMAFVGMLYCFWQAIQFFRGEASFSPISVLNSILPAGAQLSGSIDVAFGPTGSGPAGVLYYYLAGLLGYIALACIVGVSGGVAARIALVGWKKYQEERQAADKAEQARQQFKAVGELVTIRTTVANGLLSSERFTEVETTEGVFVVDGEVGTVSKGVAVSKNGYDKLRIGGPHGRTYSLRAI